MVIFEPKQQHPHRKLDTAGAIGIMGGTFNPVHFGHLRTATEVKQNLGLSELRLIPCHIPGHRTEPDVSAQHRIAMLEIAVADNPGLLVDDRECQSPNTSYTVKTLESFREEFGKEKPLLLIMGMDSFSSLHQWHQWQTLLDLAHIVVAHRPKAPLPTHQVIRTLIEKHLIKNKEALLTSPCGHLWWQTVTSLDISSSQIRQLFQEQLSPQYLLPDNVLQYIARHQLY